MLKKANVDEEEMKKIFEALKPVAGDLANVLNGFGELTKSMDRPNAAKLVSGKLSFIEITHLC